MRLDWRPPNYRGPILVTSAIIDYSASPVAGPAGFTILAQRGVYAITGQSASLSVAAPKAFTLPASAGSYSIAGSPATIKVGTAATFTLPASPGAYSISGNPVPIIWSAATPTGFTLPASPGSYHISGAPAEIQIGTAAAFTLAASPGDYRIAGAPAQIELGSAGTFTLGASPGTYRIAGSPAQITLTSPEAFTLAAAPGIYRISGMSVLIDVTEVGTYILQAATGVYLVTGGQATILVSAPISAQTFRQTLVAKLKSIPALTGIVGGAIYDSVIPQTHDLQRNGPAVTFTITTYPRGQVLMGLDGTGNARVQISAWSYTKSVSDQITLAILPVLNTVPVANPWGDGTIRIKSVSHQDESDQTEPARDGSDKYIYQIVTEWQINHYLAGTG